MGTPHRKGINRDDIYDRIKDIISSTETGRAEISSSELAREFGVRGPTMDYHLNIMIEEGLLEVANERGRYNRRIYMIPKNQSNTKKVYKSEDMDEIKEILQRKLKNKENAEIIESSEKEVHELSKEEIEESLSLDSAKDKHSEEFKSLSLDEKIEKFLEESGKAPSASDLLTQKDRELISVMNETMHQNMVYLKDLSEQLTSIKYSETIKGLIDERNKHMAEIDELKEEKEALIKAVQENTGKFDIDPVRIRLMHQNIISILDMFLDLPNHSLALKRKEFRDAITEQISSAFQYVLNLEK